MAVKRIEYSNKNDISLNPFKEATYEDLQNYLQKQIGERFAYLREEFSDWWIRFKKKGNERLTIMFIPHSEKKIVNFHVSIFVISGFTGALIAIVVVTMLLIFNHTSTVKEVSKLKLYGSDSRIQIDYYNREINSLYNVFQQFKPEITDLYSLDSGNDPESVWGKGGVENPAGLPGEPLTKNTPSVEALNLEEMEKDLETTRDLLSRIKVFMEQRRNVIKNTPSIWPVNGYILAGFGQRVSPFSSIEEYGNDLQIAATPGSEIHATAPGKVSSVFWDSDSGLTVTVQHRYGFTTVYSHCQRVSVEKGQSVEKGDVIAYVGRTGSTHEHICGYKIIIGTDYVDPLPYLNMISSKNK